MNEVEPNDLVLSRGVISFDGRVLEKWGITGGSDARLHVAMIKSIGYDGKKFVVRTRDGGQGEIGLLEEDEDKRGDLESLMDVVRRASPHLEEAS